MVVDTAYYDTLGIPPTATELEIKKAYRKQAIKLHPDKNPDDATAHEKFQAVGEAYQVLSDPQLRAAYDKYGKESAQPSAGFEDPAEMFTMIFGGEAFVDWIGEISLMKDLTKTMDITMKEMEEQEQMPAQAAVNAEQRAAGFASEHTAETQPPTTSTEQQPPPAAQAATTDSTPGPTSSGTSTPRPKKIPMRPAIMDRTEEDARLEAAGMSAEEKKLREKEAKKKGGLTKEQREELLAYEKERARVRDERVNTLAKKLIDRISVWTETDKGPDVTKAFQDKARLEVEHLKMESFGIEILHAIGSTYLQKASIFIKQHKSFLGIGGFLSKLKDKGNLAKETWGTISTAIDAQLTMEEMARAEEKGGDEWTDEKKAEYEKVVTGKILAAAWRGSKFEIQGVLRDVCEKVLNDKNVKVEKRMERAQALLIYGEIFAKAARDPDEEGDYMAFEQLMAEAAAKKEDKKKAGKDKDKDKDKKGEKEKSYYYSPFSRHSAEKSSET